MNAQDHMTNSDIGQLVGNYLKLPKDKRKTLLELSNAFAQCQKKDIQPKIIKLAFRSD